MLPGFVSAATVSFEMQPASIGVGDAMQISMYVESGVQLNTFSGTITYPADLLQIEGVSDGGSIVSMWLEKPAVENGTISFTGFTPGGFIGERGLLLRIFSRARKPGDASVTLHAAKFLRNDGAGTSEPVFTEPLKLSIATASRESFVAPVDTDPPEPFVPQLLQNADIFEDGAHLVFVAVDKVSGIDHYEIAETRPLFGNIAWKRGESPYRIVDQELTSDVYIKAVDRAGNEQIAVFPHQYLLRSYEILLLGGMLMLLALLWFYRGHKR